MRVGVVYARGSVALSEGLSGVSAAIVSGGGAWCVWVYKT